MSKDRGDKGDGGGEPAPHVNFSSSDIRSMQQAKLVFALSNGPILGAVWPAYSASGLRDIFFNDVPVLNSDGSSNFSGVAVGMTSGTLTQNPIPGFNYSESLTSSGAAILNSAPQIISVSNNGPTSIRLNISMPSMYNQDPSNGNMNGTSVTLSISVNNNGGGWVSADSQIGAAATITGMSTNTIVRPMRVNLAAFGTGPWQVRVSRTTADNSTQYLSNLTYLQSYSTIVDHPLRYPGTALLSIAIDAAHFSSMPKVSARIRGRIISVPANYTPAYKNPSTGLWVAGVYDTVPGHAGVTAGGGWDGTFKQAWTCNPAWVFMDMATNPVYGAGKYVTQAFVNKWLLYSISQYCDQTLISDGFGGTEPRFSFNGYLETPDEAFKVLTYIMSCARAQLYYAAGQVSPVQDSDGTPVSLFTRSNVVDGKFSYAGTARKARHTVVNVSWTDPGQGWRVVPETVTADDTSIQRYGIQTSNVSALGCTSRGQARRYGRWSLLSELNELEMITFSTGAEGITVRPGDLILVQDPGRKRTRLGGRVVSATTTTVQFDAPVTLAAGQTYTLYVQLADGSVVFQTVTTGAGTVSSVTVGTAFPSAPNVQSQWMLSCPNTVATRWRVVSVKEDQTTDVKSYSIQALANYQPKYAQSDSTDNLVAAAATSVDTYPLPTVLTVSSFSQLQQDRLVYSLTAKWTAPTTATPTTYAVAFRKDGGPWQSMTVSGVSATATDVSVGSYVVRATAIYDTGVSDFVESSPYSLVNAGTSPAEGAQSGVNQINSVDWLTNVDKITLVQDWNSEQQIKTQLDSQASTLSVSSTSYDNTVATLSTSLIAAGAPAGWATTWPDGTNWNSTGIMTNIQAWWASIASARTSLMNAITNKVASNSLPSTGTASNSMLLAGLSPATAATASTIAQRDASGGLTVAALTATTGAFSGAVGVNGATNGLLSVNAASGYQSLLYLNYNGQNCGGLGCNGSSTYFNSWNAGTWIDNPLSIANTVGGAITITRPTNISNSLSATYATLNVAAGSDLIKFQAGGSQLYSIYNVAGGSLGFWSNVLGGPVLTLANTGAVTVAAGITATTGTINGALFAGNTTLGNLVVSGGSAQSIAYQRTGVSAKQWGFNSDNSNTYWNNITDNLMCVSLSNAGAMTLLGGLTATTGTFSGSSGSGTTTWGAVNIGLLNGAWSGTGYAAIVENHIDASNIGLTLQYRNGGTLQNGIVLDYTGKTSMNAMAATTGTFSGQVNGASINATSTLSAYSAGGGLYLGYNGAGMAVIKPYQDASGTTGNLTVTAGQVSFSGTISATANINLHSNSYPSSYATQLVSQNTAMGVLSLGNNGANQIRGGSTFAGGYLDFYTNNTADAQAASDGILAMRLGNTGLATFNYGLAIPANTGLTIASGAQTTTANTLYATASNLYWNGYQIFTTFNIGSSTAGAQALQALVAAPQFVSSLPSIGGGNTLYPLNCFVCLVQTVSAGSFATGTQYQIVVVGTTNWSLCGFSGLPGTAVTGTTFVATNAGSGTGTATSKTMYQNQSNVWVAVGSDAAIYGQITAGSISAGAIGATALTSTLVLSSLIKSYDYADDGSPNYNPTAGFKLDSSEATYKLKVGAGQFGTNILIGAVGNTTLGDTAGRAVTGIATTGTTATDIVWWRGNSNGSVNGGAPVIIDQLWSLGKTWAVGDRVMCGLGSVAPAYATSPYIYQCTTAGAGLTSAQQSAANWSSGTTYAIGNNVTYLNRAYASKTAGNVGNTPVAGGTTYWTDLGTIWGPAGTVNTADYYVDGAAKWKCVGWQFTNSSATSGLQPWVQGATYAVGALVCADPAVANAGYYAGFEKLYGNPMGVVGFPGTGAAIVNYGGTRIYRCITAGTALGSGNGPSGTGSSIVDNTVTWAYWAENTGPGDRVQIWAKEATDPGGSITWGTYEVRIQPKTNFDNLDALTHLEVEIVGSDNGYKSQGTVRSQFNFSVPSRKYYAPSAPDSIQNMVRIDTVVTSHNAADTSFVYGAGYLPLQARLRIRLHNVNGASAPIDYGLLNTAFNVPSPYSNILTAPPSGGGGGGGGGSCPEPWVLITTKRGNVPAGEVMVGDIVSTKHETTGAWGDYEVISVERDFNETGMLSVLKANDDGSSSVEEMAFAMNHRFKRGEEWIELRSLLPGVMLDSTDGSKVTVIEVRSRGVNEVVKITVDEAHTYSTEGVLSHNIKFRQ